MPEICGITFDDKSGVLVSKLIARLEQEGDFAKYGLPRMHNGRGELRLAHEGRDTKRKVARGVFCRFIPTIKGVTHTDQKRVGGPKVRTQLTADNFDEILRRIIARRDLVKKRPATSEKVYPQPGMVSGGQFESDRRKH